MGRKYGSKPSTQTQVQQQNNKNVLSVGLLNKSFSRQVIIIAVSILVVLILGIIGFFILSGSSKLSIKNANKVLKGWNYQKISVDDIINLMEENSDKCDGVYAVAMSKDDVQRYYQYRRYEYIVDAANSLDISAVDKMLVGFEVGDGYGFKLYVMNCSSEQGAINYFEQWKSINSSVLSGDDTVKAEVEGVNDGVEYYCVGYELNYYGIYNINSMTGIWRDGRNLCIMRGAYASNSSRSLRRMADMCNVLDLEDLETALSQEEVRQAVLQEEQERLQQETLLASVNARELADRLKNDIVYEDDLSLIDFDTALNIFNFTRGHAVKEAVFYEGTGVTAEEIVVIRCFNEIEAKAFEEIFRSRIEEQKKSYNHYRSIELRKLNMAVVCIYRDWAILSVSDDSNKARDIINLFMKEQSNKKQKDDSTSVVNLNNSSVSIDDYEWSTERGGFMIDGDPNTFISADEYDRLVAMCSEGPSYAGRYVSEDIWVDTDDNEFQPVILLHNDGTCQISYKYSVRALQSVDAKYIVDGEILKISWDGYNGWPGSNQHNNVSGRILDGIIMLQDSIFRKQ